MSMDTKHFALLLLALTEVRREQVLRDVAAGCQVVEWEYPDGSGSWGVVASGDVGGLLATYLAEGCLVWVDGLPCDA